MTTIFKIEIHFDDSITALFTNQMNVCMLNVLLSCQSKAVAHDQIQISPTSILFL